MKSSLTCPVSIGSVEDVELVRQAKQRSLVFATSFAMSLETRHAIPNMVQALYERHHQQQSQSNITNVFVGPSFPEDWNRVPISLWSVFFQAFSQPPVLRIVDRGWSPARLQQIVQVSRTTCFYYEYKQGGRGPYDFASAVDAIMDTALESLTCVFSCRSSEEDFLYLLDSVQEHAHLRRFSVIAVIDYCRVRSILRHIANFIAHNTRLLSLSIQLQQSCNLTIDLVPLLDARFLQSVRHNYTLQELSILGCSNLDDPRRRKHSRIMEKIQQTVQENKRGHRTDTLQVIQQFDLSPSITRTLFEIHREHTDNTLMELMIPFARAWSEMKETRAFSASHTGES